MHPSSDDIARRLLPLDGSAAAHPDPRPRFSDYDLGDGPVPPRPRLRPAAVLVALVERPAGHTVLLTRRTDHLHDHAGQVSFPGGRLEDGDRGPVAAALRETEEEIGLAPRAVRLAGRLEPYETVTGYLVTPVVGFVAPRLRLRLDPFEVAEAFEVPLAHVLDPARHEVGAVERDGFRRRYYAIPYGRHYVWGATAGMLMCLYRRLAGVPSPPTAR